MAQDLDVIPISASSHRWGSSEACREVAYLDRARPACPGPLAQVAGVWASGGRGCTTAQSRAARPHPPRRLAEDRVGRPSDAPPRCPHAAAPRPSGRRFRPRPGPFVLLQAGVGNSQGISYHRQKVRYVTWVGQFGHRDQSVCTGSTVRGTPRCYHRRDGLVDLATAESSQHGAGASSGGRDEDRKRCP